MPNASTYAFGVLLAGAVLCSFFGSKEKRPGLVILVALITAIWIDSIRTYTGEGIAQSLWAIGYRTHVESIWEAGDFLVAALALWFWHESRHDDLAEDHFEALGLCLIGAGQLLFHAAYWEWGTLGRELYHTGLDGFFLGQLAFFYLAGGPTLGNWIAVHARSVGSRFRATIPALQKARPR